MVFFDDTAEAGRVDEIGEMIRNRPEVTGTVYTSSEDAWNQFKVLILRLKNLLEEYLKMTIRWSIPIIIRCI